MSPAYAGAGMFQFGQSEFTGKGVDSRFDQFRFGAARALDLPYPLFEFTVSVLEDKEQIIDIGPRVMPTLVPALRALLQGLVVTLLVLFD